MNEGKTGVGKSINVLLRLVMGGVGAQVGTIILIVARCPGCLLSQPFFYGLSFVIAAGLGLLGAALVVLVRAPEVG
jgi:hypothetical protein